MSQSGSLQARTENLDLAVPNASSSLVVGSIGGMDRKLRAAAFAKALVFELMA